MSDTHAQTVAFARDTMLPPAPPPRRETGAVRWLRERLFSGPLNILLTLLSIWLLWVVLKDFLPWALRGIWRAESLTDCRAIRDQLYPEGTEVACWAVITDRWRQLVFGFYPRPLANRRLHDASQAWLDSHPDAPAALRRLVVENRDPVARALEAQDRDARD